MEKAIAQYFFDNQNELFEEPVADSVSDMADFLEDSMAEIFDDIESLKEYIEEAGFDILGMTDEEVIDSDEVFKIPDGRYVFLEV